MSGPVRWSDAALEAARPWVRWWWLGSGIEEAEIDRELAMFHRAGFGGVEIQPIYAPDPPAPASVDYLSPRWIELLDHTLVVSRRLGMGVDLTTGSGWPWGGPDLEPAHVAWRLLVSERSAPDGVVDIPEQGGGEVGRVVAVSARPAGEVGPGRVVAATNVDGVRRYRADLGPGAWRLDVARELPTGQQVKRASPGAEGPVVDHFSPEAVAAFLSRFDTLFRVLGDVGVRPPRAAFTDSYEVYDADWTPAFLEAFRSCRGYDLTPWLHALDPAATDPVSRRVVHDYRQTLRELQMRSLDVWIAWCRAKGMRSRLQAHGSPGQLLDLYPASDVPETEAYGREGVIDRFARVAASASHVAGRALCSAEAFTWLDDHFLAGPDRMRHEADRFFLAGVNHLVLHGAPASPEGTPFPGLLFYASTDVSEHMPWFAHLAPLCAYIARVQRSLRWGRPDPDVLLFHPIHDVLGSPAPARLKMCTAHNTDTWLGTEIGPTAELAADLERLGVAYDFVSDAQIRSLRVRRRKLRSRGATYAALVFAGPCVADAATLEAAARLARRGGRVLFVGEVPRAWRETKDPRDGEPRPATETGAIPVIARGALEDALRRAGARGELMPGYRWIRRRAGARTLYFVKRIAPDPGSGAITVSARGGRARIADPVTGVVTRARTRATAAGTTLPIEVEAGGTRVIVVEPSAMPALTRAPRRSASGAAVALEIRGPWQLTWVGEHGEPLSLTLERLASWPARPEIGLYSGRITYETCFSMPAPGTGAWILDLGVLHVTAEARLNGVPLGIAWTRPYRLSVPADLPARRNTLHLVVANLAANRIIALDREGVTWKRSYFAGLDGRGFDASGWTPLPSGLLGPVRLLPA